jgi:hypothetical protein
MWRGFARLSQELAPTLYSLRDDSAAVAGFYQLLTVKIALATIATNCYDNDTFI